MNLAATPTSLLAATLFAALAADPAAAQSCGLRNRYRIVNSHSGAGSELVVDSGIVLAGPLASPGSNSNPSPTCNSQGSCNPIADYGYLHCDGAGTANNCPTSGVFLWLDGGPQAEFFDSMTVVSSTLPHGAPVQVRCILTLTGSAQMVDPNPAVSFGATLAGGSLYLAASNAAGTVVGVLQTTVGASVQLQGKLNVTLYGYGMLGLGIPPQSFAYSLDVTARVGVTSLTPGTTLQFCSGHDYTPQASATAIAGGCGPSSPQLAATAPVLGANQSYAVTSAPATQPVFLAWALGNPVGVPIGGCVVTEAPNAAALVPVGASDAAGACGFVLAIPSSGALTGLTLTTQAFVLTPGGPLFGFAELSNGVFSTLGF